MMNWQSIVEIRAKSDLSDQSGNLVEVSKNFGVDLGTAVVRKESHQTGHKYLKVAVTVLFDEQKIHIRQNRSSYRRTVGEDAEAGDGLEQLAKVADSIGVEIEGVDGCHSDGYLGVSEATDERP